MRGDRASIRRQKRIDEQRSVSPVIGVLLMVVIVVVLATMIGAFALGFADELAEPQPVAVLGIDANPAVNAPANYQFDFTHESGHSVHEDELTMIVDGEPAEDFQLGIGEFAAGERATIEWEGGDISPGHDDVADIAIRHDPSEAVLVREADVVLAE